MLEPRRDIPLTIAVAGFFLAAGTALERLGPPWGSIAALTLLLALLTGVVLLCYRRLMRAVRYYADQEEQRGATLFRQVEAYTQLHGWIQPRLPLPRMRGMAISPDFGLALLHEIQRVRPGRIVELGCGTSTLLAAYCLERLGGGELISVDHDSRYAGECRELLEAHGLTRWASVRDAPLRQVPLHGREWTYYDRTVLEHLGPIDLLVVDGPPEWTGEMARYPALPLLHAQMSPGAVVLIDDTRRDGEARMVRRWLEEFPEFQSVPVEAEKGAVLLRRQAS